MVILPINFGRCTYFVKGKLWEQQIDHYFSNGIFSCCNLLGAKINVFMLKYCAFSKVKKKGASTEIYRYNVKNKDTGSLSGMCQVNLKNTWMKLLEVAIVSFSSDWTSFSCIFSNGNLGPVEFSWNSSVQAFFICRDANRFKLYQYQISLLQCQQLNSLTLFVSLMWNTDAAFNFGFNGKLILV